MKTVYLDNNATTQMAPEVVKAMFDASHLYGNASSMHSVGRESMAAIEQAREYIGDLLNVDSDNIIFTSGGSESDNNIFYTATSLIDKGSTRNRIIVSTIEHPAIIETCKDLELKGYKIEYVPVDSYGMVLPSSLEKMMGEDVLLVSIMSANNETGTIQPIKELTKIAHNYGSLVHTDAVQAVGKMKVDGKDWDVDYMSISGHKFYGPKGVGALYVKEKAPFETFVKGGHQEDGRRAGTYNTMAIIGMGEAARLILEEDESNWAREWKLREKLRVGISHSIENTVVNGHPTSCLPGTLNMSFPQAEGESILLMLDFEGIAVSTGSACATGSLEPSYVLLASGLDIELAHGSIRFSLGRYTTTEDIDYVIEKVGPIVKRLRGISTR
ncbi:MAG: aminotransferase class V-fold PLP-dependent enzyme [Spirochaetia bacterium]|nr:aminotransferase class V-fold PLP-dependent enzyme [Spirochaetia bacterium]